MNRFQKFIRRMMVGRNGLDVLNQLLFGLYLVAWIVDWFVDSWMMSAGVMLIVLVFLFRFFSKNLYQRNKENQAWLRFLRPFVSFFRLQMRKWNERKTHRFRRCKQCKTVLRIKRVKGKHTVVCPRCQHENTVRIRW